MNFFFFSAVLRYSLALYTIQYDPAVVLKSSHPNRFGLDNFLLVECIFSPWWVYFQTKVLHTSSLSNLVVSHAVSYNPQDSATIHTNLQLFPPLEFVKLIMLVANEIER